jgi:ATP-binding cassette, subfamily B, bacterial
MSNSKPKKQLFARETIKLYLRATLKYKKLSILSLGLPIAAVLTSVFAPLFASKLLAALAAGSENATHYLIGFIVFALGGLIINQVGITANVSIQSRVMSDLFDRMMERLLQRSVGFYADRVGGKLVSDALDFVTAYTNLVVNGFIKGFGFIAIVVTGVIVLTLTSWKIGLILTVILSGLTFWTIKESINRKHIRAKRLKIYKELAGHFSDNIVNAVTVKTFAREADELATSHEINERLQTVRQHDWIRATRSENYRVSIIVLAQIVLFFALVQIIRNDPSALSAGIFAFAYMLTLLNRFYEINTIVRQIDESILNASQMTEILLQPIEITDAQNAKPLKVNQGSLVIDSLDFVYPGNDEKVFDDLSLDIPAGQKVGLIGHSGGGKTTLTRLLLRFDDITAGSITIDGQNIAQVTQESLRKNIAYVPQEPLLFHRSIIDNIRYGKPEASEADVIAAAKQANAHDFISKLSDGYETFVGERGVKLSGGQRQRVAIARAILKDAPILVLDEATSALDSESERLIQKSLRTLMKGRTAIVIAHRLSTIKNLDRIIVLDDGKITEDGTHAELLEQNGLYASLWNHQSGGFIEE